MSNQPIPTLSVQALKKAMDASEITVIDVREAHERAEACIPGTHHLVKDSIAEQIGSLCPDKSEQIYLHCRSGVRSLIAAQILINQGYTAVYSVEGGILAWAEAGYPITTLL